MGARGTWVVVLVVGKKWFGVSFGLLSKIGVIFAGGGA